MFDAQAAARLKTELADFSLARPTTLAASPPLLAEYFEHYGFFTTLKDFDGDYFLGHQAVLFGEENIRVATHFWRQPSARGTVVVVHGLFDHVGIFQHLILYLLRQNYSVFAFDLPGHGLSDGAATGVAHFADYSQVLASLLQHLTRHAQKAHLALTQPFYGLGQSTGAAVIMGHVFACKRMAEAEPFARLIFFGPLIRPRRWRLSRLSLKLFGGFLDSVHRDMNSPNSHDDEFHHFLRFHDPLQSKRLAVSWVRALDEWIGVCAKAPVVDTPLLIVQGTGDRVVDWRTNIPELKRLFACHQLNYVEGAMHHMVNEADPWRQAIFASVGQFLKQRAVCEPKPQ